MSILRVIHPSNPQNDGNVVQSQRQAIAILLLDLENIKLDPGEEKFLQTCCKYPLQVKIAFANWRTISSQQDTELNDRGYQMIHVPAGKNSADMKMTAIGSSLFVPYPNVKEVLVCSSDADLIHLCNTLQINGLAVQAVRKHADLLTVLNLATGQSVRYSQPSVSLLIPSMDECLRSIKALIQSEQSIQKPWVKLSELSKKFREVHGFTLSYLMRHYEPGKKARDLFSDRPTEFVMHQPEEKGEIYICLFVSDPQPKTTLSEIKSRQSLEKALMNALKTLLSESELQPVKITEFLSQFQKQQGQPISYFLKALAINHKPVAFLMTCSAFRLELLDKVWQIELRKL